MMSTTTPILSPADPSWHSTRPQGHSWRRLSARFVTLMASISLAPALLGACAGFDPNADPTSSRTQYLGPKIKVAGVQYGPSKSGAEKVDATCLSRTDYNTCAVEKLVEQAAAQGAQIIVTPELALDQQYYETDPSVGALPADDTTLADTSLLKIFAKKAKTLGVFLAVHFHSQDDRTKKKFSTQIVYDKTGKVVGVHHKFELYGGENTSLTHGSDNTIIQTPLGKTAPLICADLYGDPRHHSKLVDDLGARVILVSSYWTVPSGARWQAAFAKNWGVYVIGSNVTTSAGRGGGIYDPNGKALIESLAAEPKVLIAEIPTSDE